MSAAAVECRCSRLADTEDIMEGLGVGLEVPGVDLVVMGDIMAVLGVGLVDMVGMVGIMVGEEGLVEGVGEEGGGRVVEFALQLVWAEIHSP
ncbi:hypothetical protein ASPCADRAFT_4866 [Aspergillus carbonarius ITEM 5010]|uniref:Uncharacterized protein n=1 Tax=Aspergillus carbonarius (strain ITEM 5010) TaxID=602072 RepID=A0A1R3RQS3_ASPC5|nr:hypothetical protein ASPCADRAFT_4866 [Aspergillus carbonarius ITEM 5010]